MKRIDLIRGLEQSRCLLIGDGGKHDRHQNPRTGASQPIPRHRVIRNFFATHILRKPGIE
jgi:hypothetical protein